MADPIDSDAVGERLVRAAIADWVERMGKRAVLVEARCRESGAVARVVLPAFEYHAGMVRHLEAGESPALGPGVALHSADIKGAPQLTETAGDGAPHHAPTLPR